MGLQNLLQDAKVQKKTGGLAGLVSGARQISDKQIQAQREAEAYEFEAQHAVSFGGVAKDSLRRLWDIIPNTLRATRDIYASTPGKIRDDIVSGAEDMQRGFQDPSLSGAGSVLKGTAKAGARTSADVAHAIFAPLSGFIGSVLQATGGSEIVNKAGEKIADSSGITDWPAFQRFAMEHPNAGEDFNRLMMLGMSKFDTGRMEPGTVIPRTTAQITELSQAVARKVAKPTPKDTGFRRLTVESQSGETQVPLNTPKTRLARYSQEQGYEPYTQPGELPVIPMGPQRGGLPVIQTGVRQGDFLPQGARLEPVNELPITKATLIPETKVAAPIGAAPIEMVTGGTKSSKVGLSIQAKAVEEGLASKFDDTAMFEGRTVKDQARRVARIIDDGDARLARIVRGEESLPEGVSGSMFVKGVEDYALATGNSALLRDLARSRLVSETSIHASELRLLAERDPLSPVKIIQDINKSRSTKVGKDFDLTKRREVASIQKEISRVVPTKKVWEEFIKEIECK